MSQDRPSAQPTVMIDNARTRVTEWRFAPGAETGHHRHEYDYVVVPIMTGSLRIVAPDGSESVSELRHGAPYFRPAGVEHNVINGGPEEFAFIEVEFK
jgi:mannose-6-phosphate isomerase-like protein (cupin superfamily)